MTDIPTSDWLTRGIPEKKLLKEKAKALKKHDRYMRKLKRKQCRLMGSNCVECEFHSDNACLLDKRDKV